MWKKKAKKSMANKLRAKAEYRKYIVYLVNDIKITGE